MTRKIKLGDEAFKPVGETQKLSSAKYRGYVKVSLSDEIKADYREWVLNDGSDLSIWIGLVFAQHYQLKIQRASDNTCYQASLYACDVVPAEQCGYILVGRGSSWEEALSKLLFYHFVLYDKSWPVTDDSQEITKREYW